MRAAPAVARGRWWRRREGNGGRGSRAAAQGQQRHDGILVARARSGGDRHGRRGGDGDRSWTPSPAFGEQSLEMEETPFFLK